MLGLAGDDEASVAEAVLRRKERRAPQAARPRHRRQQVEVPGRLPLVERERRRHAGRDRPVQDRLTLHALLHLVLVLGESFLVDQPLRVQLVDPAQPVAPAVGGERGHHRAAVQVEAVAGVVVLERVHQVAVEGGVPAGGGAGERHLVGLAVAVGILRLERRQHRVQLVGGLRNLQAELVEPSLVVPDALAVVAVVAQVVVAQAVDVAVRRGADLLDQRVLLEEPLHLGAVLVDEVVQRQEQPLAAVQRRLFRGDDAVAQEHVRQVGGAGQHQVDLLTRILARQHVPLHVHAGLLLQPLGSVVGGQILHRHTRDCRHPQGHRLLDDRQHPGRRHRHPGGPRLRLARRERGPGRAYAQQRGNQTNRDGSRNAHLSCLLVGF